MPRSSNYLPKLPSVYAARWLNNAFVRYYANYLRGKANGYTIPSLRIVAKRFGYSKSQIAIYLKALRNIGSPALNTYWIARRLYAL
jgi:hypothetical protein